MAGCQGFLPQGISAAVKKPSRFMTWYSRTFDGYQMTDLDYMQLAIEEARASADAGEVPIGAVLALDGKVIARSGNRTIRDCDPTAHADMVVLRHARKCLETIDWPTRTVCDSRAMRHVLRSHRSGSRSPAGLCGGRSEGRSIPFVFRNSDEPETE